MKTEKWFEPIINEMLLLLSFESDTPPAHVSFLSRNNKEFIQLLIPGHSLSHEGGDSHKSWSFHNHSSQKRTKPNVHYSAHPFHSYTTQDLVHAKAPLTFKMSLPTSIKTFILKYS